jgi:hypothetical protein
MPAESSCLGDSRWQKSALTLSFLPAPAVYHPFGKQPSLALLMVSLENRGQTSPIRGSFEVVLDRVAHPQACVQSPGRSRRRGAAAAGAAN